jgi:spore coat protein U-like protein
VKAKSLGCGAAVLAALLLFGPRALSAQSWTVSASSPALSYTLTGTSEATGTITIKRSSGKTASALYVVFKLVSLSSTAPSGGESLSYGLYSSSSSTTALSLTGSPTSSDQVLSGSFASGSTTATASYAFRVSNSTFPGAGTYTAKISATVYKGTWSAGANPSSRGSVTITATATVPKIASVAVVGGAGDSYSFKSATSSPNYTLNLGSLAAGSSGSAYLLALCNSSFSLSLSSANKGSLVCSADASSMAYTVTVDSGSTYSLNAAATIVSGASATYSTAARHSLLVRIPSIGTNPSAGTYTDTVTVTVAAL